MSRLGAFAASALRRRLLSRAGRSGIDLSQVDRLPARLTWPLERVGVDPVQRLSQLRSQAPVSRLTTFMGMTVWLVTGEAEARTVLADTATFSTDIRSLVGRHAAGVEGGLGFTDPPDHTRLRKLLTPEFTRRRLERLQPRIDEIVRRQLDEVDRRARSGPGGSGFVDLVSSFAFPIPFLVICELLGIPEEDRAPFRELSAARFDVSSGGAGVFGAMSEACRFLMDVTARQRDAPGDGLIGQIIRDHGEQVSDLELNQLVDGVFTGGFETSASMLALGTLVLLDHPDRFWAMGDDVTVVDRTVEELLRHLTPVQLAFPRFPRVPVDVGGQRFEPADVVVVHLAGANRDARGGDRDVFDPDRSAGPILPAWSCALLSRPSPVGSPSYAWPTSSRASVARRSSTASTRCPSGSPDERGGDGARSRAGAGSPAAWWGPRGEGAAGSCRSVRRAAGAGPSRR